MATDYPRIWRISAHSGGPTGDDLAVINGTTYGRGDYPPEHPAAHALAPIPEYGRERPPQR